MRSLNATVVSLVILTITLPDKSVAAFHPANKLLYKASAVPVGRPAPHIGSSRSHGYRSGVAVKRRSVSARLRFANQQDDTNDALEQKEQDPLEANTTESPTPSLPPLPKLDASILLPWFLFVSFWPLLTLVRLKLDGVGMGNPVEYFDIDKYTALKSIMAEPPDNFDETILELPPLSPAEQLVGALFGPPKR